MNGFFTACEQGHDLTQPSAYVYSSVGLRQCRQCAIIAKNGSRKKTVSYSLHTKERE